MLSSSSTESSNLFSKFFLAVHNHPSPSYTQYLPQNLPFDLPSSSYYSPNDIFTALETFKNNNSNGPDDISTCLLFNCHYSLAFPLILLYRFAFKCISRYLENVFNYPYSQIW